MNRPLITAIVGPTASGKSFLAMQLASESGAEIISADSRQVYRYLDVGTAKPSRSDLDRIPHHFVDILNPDEEYNAGRYGKEARARIGQLIARRAKVIVVGGSGLYLQALIDGFFEGPGRDPELRAQLESRREWGGDDALWKLLDKVDPMTAARVNPRQSRRIIRALEVYSATGKPISQWHLEQHADARFDVLQIAIRWDREELYRMIERRCDAMLEAGLVAEVEALIGRGYDRGLNALNTVGYKEAFDFLEGRMDRSTMIDAMKKNTRRFAKRQLTWFRADSRINWIDAKGKEWWKGVENVISGLKSQNR